MKSIKLQTTNIHQESVLYTPYHFQEGQKQEKQTTKKNMPHVLPTPDDIDPNRFTKQT